MPSQPNSSHQVVPESEVVDEAVLADWLTVFGRHLLLPQPRSSGSMTGGITIAEKSSQNRYCATYCSSQVLILEQAEQRVVDVVVRLGKKSFLVHRADL